MYQKGQAKKISSNFFSSKVDMYINAITNNYCIIHACDNFTYGHLKLEEDYYVCCCISV